jgi:rod shape-determining protein MreB and related proteins
MASFFSRKPDLAIDFGTANLRVIRRDEGVVFDEPSLCCFSKSGVAPGLIAAGMSAQAMVDRTTGHLEVKRPLRRGVLQDIDSARELLRYAVPKALGRKRSGPVRTVIGVPADATMAERSALLTAARDAGIGSVRLVAEPFAAAIGAGLPVSAATGTMLVECGAGTTEVAVLSLGGICLTRSVRIGGASLDQAIADSLHFRHKFLIGDTTAERVKQDYVAQRQTRPGAAGTIAVKGRSLTSGMPTTIDISLKELDTVVGRHVGEIVEVVLDVLGGTSPELSQDIHNHGIVLTGGSAVVPLIRSMLEDATGLRVVAADTPAQCVPNGLHQMLLH